MIRLRLVKWLHWRAWKVMAWCEERLSAHDFDQRQVCRQCGCWDLDCSGCVERTGEPCYWVDDDLCSACADPDDHREDALRYATGGI